MFKKLPSGILVPQAILQPVVLFCDETYLLNNSGFIQTAIPIPKNVCRTLKPMCLKLLKRLGKDATEFKGSGLKNGNRSIYEEFLRYFVNVSATIGDKYPLRPIIAIDSMGTYAGQQFNWALDNVVGGFQNLGITGEDHLAAEFSRQMLWLHRHFKSISPTVFANLLIVTFDNKHQYAQKCNSIKLVSHKNLPGGIFRRFDRVLTSFANTMFEHMTPKQPIPKIQTFEFKWSPAEFGLQAADLFCNLMYNALKFELGIRNATTALKHDVLLQVFPAFAIDTQLAAVLRVAKDNQGRDDIECTDPGFLSRFILEPVPVP